MSSVSLAAPISSGIALRRFASSTCHLTCLVTIAASVTATSLQSQTTPGDMTMNTAPLGVPAQRMGSGTSWQPDASPMRASHSMLGSWDVMLHGAAFVQYDEQRSKRGDRQFGSVNWGMIAASRSVAGGMFSMRGMLSAEPFTIGSRGYPLLLQSGEAYRGQPLHDRQHPHDMFMELAATYDHALSKNVAVSLYAAPVGEPAIGPVAFPHRASASSNPLAPLGHHWQDATHISFGVITAGVYTRAVKLEGSVFNGREPDDIRTNFDYKGRSLDSYAGRLTFNPNEHWSLSGSYAYLESPEQLAPTQSVHRLVASAIYGRAFGTTGDWASTFIYGANKHAGESQQSNSLLAESNLQLDDHNTIFGRTEFTQKTAEDLVVPGPTGIAGGSPEFGVSEITFGYVRELATGSGGTIGIGAAATLNIVPQALQSVYGSRTPPGGVIFFRFRPGLMKMSMHHDAKPMHMPMSAAVAR